jgi:hypothetical protein
MEPSEVVRAPWDSIQARDSASFWTVTGGKIVRGTEYWSSVGAGEAPSWRAAYVEPISPDGRA